MQVLENLVTAYRARHAHCLNSTTLPTPYVLMSMVDEYAGLGNQFPGIITGEQCPFLPETNRATVPPACLSLSTIELMINFAS